MRRLDDHSAQDALAWLLKAADVATRSQCLRPNGKCGAVIIGGDTILGFSYNRPPWGTKILSCWKDDIKNRLKLEGYLVSSFKRGWLPTCCLHAEELAILNALERKPSDDDAEDYFEGAVMYFARVDDNGNITPSGRPWCTRCSSKAAEYNIGWCLMHKKEAWGEEGIYVYTSKEYNEISFRYH
jgi:hypothetical protein